MGIKFANNASSVLASSITDTDLSLTVQTGEGAEFPTLSTGDFFFCTIESGATREIVKVTARSTDTFTIVRAQEGTTAQNWNAGTSISNRITAGSLTSLNLIHADVSGTTQTASDGYYYQLNNVAATAVTAPPAADGVTFGVVPANGLLTNTIDFGAGTVKGPFGEVTGVLTLDVGPIYVRYSSTLSKWVQI